MNVKSVTKDWLTDNMSKSITLHKKWDFVDYELWSLNVYSEEKSTSHIV